MRALEKTPTDSSTSPHRETSPRRTRPLTPPSPEPLRPPPALLDRPPPALPERPPPDLPSELPNAADNATIKPEIEKAEAQKEEAGPAQDEPTPVGEPGDSAEAGNVEKVEDEAEESDGPDFVLPGGLSLGFDVRAKPKSTVSSPITSKNQLLSPVTSKTESPVDSVPKHSGSTSSSSPHKIKRKPVGSPSILISESDFGRPLSEEAVFSSPQQVSDTLSKPNSPEKSKAESTSVVQEADQDDTSRQEESVDDDSKDGVVEEPTTVGAQEPSFERPSSTMSSLYNCSIDIPTSEDQPIQASQELVVASPSPMAEGASPPKLGNVGTPDDTEAKEDPFHDNSYPQQDRHDFQATTGSNASPVMEVKKTSTSLDPSIAGPSATRQQRLSLDKELPPVNNALNISVDNHAPSPSASLPTASQQATVIGPTSPAKAPRQRPPIPTTPSITFTEPVQQPIQPAPSISEDSADLTLSHQTSSTSLRQDTTSSYDSNSTVSSGQQQDIATIFSTPTATNLTASTSLSLAPTMSTQEREREEVRTKLEDLRRQLDEAKARGDNKKFEASLQDSIALIQRTYLSSKSSHNRSPSGRGASSMLRRLPSSISLPSKNKGPKVESIFEAASNGNSIKLEKLLDEKDRMNVNMRRTGDLKTPLMRAAIEGQLECMQVLKDRGADPFTVDSSGRTVLHLAVAANKLASVQWLLAAFPPSTPNTVGYERRKLFSISALSDPSKISPKSLLETSDKEGSRPLHVAASRGFKEVATALLDSSAHLHSKNNWSRTPLFPAVCKGDIPTITLLLDHGAALEDQDINRMTPLHCASEKDHVPVIRLLLSRGASRGLYDSSGYLPIHRAAKLGHLSSVEAFITSSADFSLKTQHGSTLLHVAVSANALPVAETLIKNNVDVNPWASPRPVRTDDHGNHHTLPKDPNAKGASKKTFNTTPLHHACFAGLFEITALLIDAGAWVNAPLEDGRTPLMLAVLSGNVNVVTLLLARGAKAGAKIPHSCITAAHLAAEQASLEMLQHLYVNGASMAAKDSDFRSVLDWTMKAGSSSSSSGGNSNLATAKKECRSWIFAVQPKMVQKARNDAAQNSGFNNNNHAATNNFLLPADANNNNNLEGQQAAAAALANHNALHVTGSQGNTIVPSPMHFGDCLHCRNAAKPGGVMVPHLEPSPTPQQQQQQQQTVVQHVVHHHYGEGPITGRPSGEAATQGSSNAWDNRYDAFPDASPPPYEPGPNAPKNLLRAEGVWRGAN